MRRGRRNHKQDILREKMNLSSIKSKNNSFFSFIYICFILKIPTVLLLESPDGRKVGPWSDSHSIVLLVHLLESLAHFRVLENAALILK